MKTLWNLIVRLVVSCAMAVLVSATWVLVGYAVKQAWGLEPFRRNYDFNQLSVDAGARFVGALKDGFPLILLTPFVGGLVARSRPNLVRQVVLGSILTPIVVVPIYAAFCLVFAVVVVPSPMEVLDHSNGYSARVHAFSLKWGPIAMVTGALIYRAFLWVFVRRAQSPSGNPQSAI